MYPTTRLIYLTALIVRSVHQRVQCNGVKETMIEIWANCWIIGGRSQVKSLIHKWVICRQFEGRPLNTPPAPPLPSFIEPPPSTYTAVGFACPMYLRVRGNQIATRCGFVCLHVSPMQSWTSAGFVNNDLYSNLETILCQARTTKKYPLRQCKNIQGSRQSDQYNAWPARSQEPFVGPLVGWTHWKDGDVSKKINGWTSKVLLWWDAYSHCWN